MMKKNLLLFAFQLALLPVFCQTNNFNNYLVDAVGDTIVSDCYGNRVGIIKKDIFW
jgi:hypothetical protein